MKMIPKAEAEKKWCPFARQTAHGPNAGINRAATQFDYAQGGTRGLAIGVNCITTQCMAWHQGAWSNGHEVRSAPEEFGLLDRKRLVEVGCCALMNNGRPQT